MVIVTWWFNECQGIDRLWLINPASTLMARWKCNEMNDLKGTLSLQGWNLFFCGYLSLCCASFMGSYRPLMGSYRPFMGSYHPFIGLYWLYGIKNRLFVDPHSSLHGAYLHSKSTVKYKLSIDYDNLNKIENSTSKQFSDDNWKNWKKLSLIVWLRVNEHNGLCVFLSGRLIITSIQ